MNYRVQEFCEAWKAKDLDRMDSMSQLTVKMNKDEEERKDILKRLPIIKSYVIHEIEPIDDCFVDARVTVETREGSRGCIIRMVQEIEPYKPSVRGFWGINPLSILKSYIRLRPAMTWLFFSLQMIDFDNIPTLIDFLPL